MIVGVVLSLLFLSASEASAAIPIPVTAIKNIAGHASRMPETTPSDAAIAPVSLR